MSPRLSDGDTTAHLRAELEVERREKQEWADRARRLQIQVDELQDDLKLWRLRFRLRHWLIQLPPEAPFIPSQRAAPEQRRPLRRTQRPDEVRARRAFHGGAR